MKKKILLAAAAFFIVGLALFSVQASNFSQKIPSDDLALMAAEENTQSRYPMGCHYAWEAFFCNNQSDGAHCRRGTASGEFCNDGQSSIIAR